MGQPKITLYSKLLHCIYILIIKIGKQRIQIIHFFKAISNRDFIEFLCVRRYFRKSYFQIFRFFETLTRAVQKRYRLNYNNLSFVRSANS